ncbi:N-acetylmuramoyl-L-alanine amidase family protein [Arenibacter certesii]|uniref:N-acetylmuramoyl-L-alanine amidase family protein n=1 Tax=Arenibacter certesii TaxID=228955 RepID=UPI00373FDF82
MNKKTYLLFCLLGLMILSGYSQTSLKTVVAEKGDGIYSLLRKQGLSPAKHYGHFIALNKDNLWDSIHLFQGREYILPPVVVDSVMVADSVQENTTEIKKMPQVVEESLFGKEHTLVPVKSNKLNGAVYYLVSGNGGPDPGAVATYKGKMIAEDEYAYDITLRLAKELMSHGAETYIIIQDPNDGIRDYGVLEVDRDEVVYPSQEIPLNQLQRLRQRVDIVNKLYLKNKGKYQRLIVTHVDSRSKGQNIDVFFYHHEKSINGKHLAESIHETFLNKYRKYQPNRVYEGTFGDRSGLYMVKNTLPAMAYIEVGNIRNKKDQRRILDPNNRQAVANWISEGIILDRTRKSR